MTFWRRRRRRESDKSTEEAKRETGDWCDAVCEGSCPYMAEKHRS